MGLLDVFKRKKKDQAAMERPQDKRKDFGAPQKEEKKESKEKKAKKGKEKLEVKDKKRTLKEDTKDAYRVLVKPLVTEKATMTGAYYFAVNPKTNKQEIKKAIQALYGVTPVKVNVMNFGGRKVRWGRTSGTTSAWKKAIVILKKGDKIEMFEGV